MGTTKLNKLCKDFDNTLVTSMKSLNEGRKAVHATACAALFHAAEHGDPTYLDRLHTALGTENDQRALKRWLGELVFGEIRVIDWLTFSGDKFKVKPNTENMRKGSVDDAILATPLFFGASARKNNAWEEDSLYTSVISLAKRARNKRDNGEEVSESTINFLDGIASQAEREQIKLKAAKLLAEDSDNKGAESQEDDKSDDTKTDDKEGTPAAAAA